MGWGRTPQPPGGGDPEVTFHRNTDGIWCKYDSKNRLVPVDRIGERWSKVPLKKGGEARPPEFTSAYWWNVLSKKERLAYWKEKEQ